MFLKSSLTILGLLALPVCAENAGVICLQNQLNALGYDVGAADGVIGRNTRNGVQNYMADRELAGSMPVTYSNGSALCRQVGLNDDLRNFWPSAEADLRFEVDDDFDSRVAGIIRSFARTIYRDVQERLDVELAGTDTVFMATSARSLGAMMDGQMLGYSIYPDITSLDRICGSSRNISATAIPNQLAICMRSGVTFGQGIELDWVRYMLAAQVVYLVQFQVNGTLPVDGYSDQRRLQFEGPVWLQEGLASVIANTMSTSATELEYQAIQLAKYEGNTLPSLSLLETRSAFEERRSDVRRVGIIAVVDLVEKFGYPPFGRLMEDMGRGVPWDAAFEAQFGISPEAYYASFEERYRD